MSTENFENFYNDVITAIRDSLTNVSGLTWTSPLPIDDESKYHEVPLSEEGGWMPVVPHQPWYADFQLVDVARLGDVALIAFRWRETGDEIFVHLADMRPFVTELGSVKWAESIITTNLLERLGGGWYQHHMLRKIKGLTFIEDTPPGKQKA